MTNDPQEQTKLSDFFDSMKVFDWTPGGENNFTLVVVLPFSPSECLLEVSISLSSPSVQISGGRTLHSFSGDKIAQIVLYCSSRVVAVHKIS